MKRALSILALLAMLGVGCAPTALPGVPNTNEPAASALEPTPAADAYEGWGTLQPGGVVSLRIPPGCTGDPGAGNIYVVCPTADNPTPIPDMHISSDGQQVNIRRWEGLEWAYWDDVIASIRILTPLDRDVQLNIEK